MTGMFCQGESSIAGANIQFHQGESSATWASRQVYQGDVFPGNFQGGQQSNRWYGFVGQSQRFNGNRNGPSRGHFTQGKIYLNSFILKETMEDTMVLDTTQGQGFDGGNGENFGNNSGGFTNRNNGSFDGSSIGNKDGSLWGS